MAQKQGQSIDDLIRTANNEDIAQPMAKYLGFAQPAPKPITPYASPNQNNSCVLFPVPDGNKGGLQPVLHPLLNSAKRSMTSDIINMLLEIFKAYQQQLWILHQSGQLTEYGSQEDFLDATKKGKAILDKLTTLWGQKDGAADFSYDGKSGSDLFDMIQRWRGDNHCNTLFFNSIFDFECPVAVRGMLEGDSPVTQCRNLYRDAGGDDGELSAIPRGTGLSATEKNPDGLANGRDPIWWCIEKDGEKTWLRPVTCYICETYLYDTNFEDNDMQCEHFFPFLEAQLLWSLKIPSKISFDGQNQYFQAKAKGLLNREYGPVCRLCNCNPHKGGKNILSFNTTPTAVHPNGSFQINTDTIDAIVKDSSKASVGSKGRPRPKVASVRTRMLDRNGRQTRCQRVFEPLRDYVNFDLQNKSKKDIADTMLIRYFYYFNQTTCRKFCAALVDGEDIEKKIKRQENLKDEIRKKDKEVMKIKEGLVKICSDIKTLIPQTKITLKGIISKAGKIIKRRSGRVKKLQDAQKEKIKNLKQVLQYYKTQVTQGADNLHSIILQFDNRWQSIITNEAELLRLATDESQKEQFITAVNDLNTNYNNLKTLIEAAFNKRKTAAQRGIVLPIRGGGLLNKGDVTVTDAILLLKILKERSIYFFEIYSKFIEIIDRQDKLADIAYTFFDSLEENLYNENLGYNGNVHNVITFYRNKKKPRNLYINVNISHYLSNTFFLSNTLFDDVRYLNQETMVKEAEENLQNAILSSRENQLRISNNKPLSRNTKLDKEQQEQVNLFYHFYKNIYKQIFPRLYSYQKDTQNLYSHHQIYKYCADRIDRTFYEKDGIESLSCSRSQIIGNELNEAISMVAFVCTKTFRNEHPKQQKADEIRKSISELSFKHKQNEFFNRNTRFSIEIDFTQNASGATSQGNTHARAPARNPRKTQEQAQAKEQALAQAREILRARAQALAREKELAREQAEARKQAEARARKQAKKQAKKQALAQARELLRERARAQAKALAREQGLAREQAEARKQAEARARNPRNTQEQARLGDILHNLAMNDSPPSAPGARGFDAAPLPSTQKQAPLTPPHIRAARERARLAKAKKDVTRLPSLTNPKGKVGTIRRQPRQNSNAKRRAPGTDKGRTSRSGEYLLNPRHLISPADRKQLEKARKALEKQKVTQDARGRAADIMAVSQLPPLSGRGRITRKKRKRKRKKKTKRRRKKKKKTRRKNKRKKKTKRRRKKKKKTRRRR